MLNYIIPPIVIVVATSVLIVFLFKKAQKIPAQEIIESGLEGKHGRKKMSEIMSTLGQFWLRLLERIMHRLKLISLKLHNTSNDWFHSIREKRQQRIQMEREMKELENDAVHKPEGEIEMPVYRRKHSLQDQIPLVREPIVMTPQAKIREKNKFEDALIKRIAINPKDIEAYERLGDYYLENENFQDSVECFKQVLKLSPLNYKARLRMRRLEKLIG